MEMSGYGYTARAGETVDSISRNVYGKERYAAELLCANPELCTKSVMTGGEVWRLPVISVPDDNEIVTPVKAPWKE